MLSKDEPAESESTKHKEREARWWLLYWFLQRVGVLHTHVMCGQNQRCSQQLGHPAVVPQSPDRCVAAAITQNRTKRNGRMRWGEIRYTKSRLPSRSVTPWPWSFGYSGNGSKTGFSDSLANSLTYNLRTSSQLRIVLSKSLS